MFYFITSLSQQRTSSQPKVHEFHDGESYIFESATESKDKFYLTAWRKGIQLHDQIILNSGDSCRRYTVEQIEYYDASNLWTALLAP